MLRNRHSLLRNRAAFVFCFFSLPARSGMMLASQIASDMCDVVPKTWCGAVPFPPPASTFRFLHDWTSVCWTPITPTPRPTCRLPPPGRRRDRRLVTGQNQQPECVFCFDMCCVPTPPLDPLFARTEVSCYPNGEADSWAGAWRRPLTRLLSKSPTWSLNR